ncbi:chemotaxis protein CheX [Sporomusa acidovorans]|uniref:CheY-P phosphatase CheX n=1 Tax=Sporomusa acidovorans (strain ATCC 49682 / DSM 3132 / Mol) TaxID=1123286 RepID=A0ABZ3IX78_SPOA4|nr:chemotaxis protein CheX [Sporomusa acidovorans]OZC13895.1 CheY-P phosphatase CheX [Sporomusa acidovorans DSM 3132]SDF49078.1 chemotaxis protein CheX [Sporomusa acidovorans]
MDVKLINPFLEAVTTVLPQLGFKEINRGGLAVKEHLIEGRGVTVLVGITKGVKGNVAYNMSTATAKKIASTMMMGMPIVEIDEMVQSAISEMVNMVTANAATNFEKQGLVVDISPPNMVVGSECAVKVSNSKYLSLDLLVDSEIIQLNIGIGS